LYLSFEWCKISRHGNEQFMFSSLFKPLPIINKWMV
jgi:hypothetical protein